MTIPSFTPGYPPDRSSLGQTKVAIRNNLDGTFQTLGVDHVNNNGQPGSNPAGHHTVIHQVTQTNVSTVADVNQIFSGVPGTLVVDGNATSAIPPDGFAQLFSLNSGGGLHQLTGARPNAPNGYAWAGGILFQWGRINAPSDTGSVNFSTANVNFPHTCFTVMLQLQRNGSSSTHAVYLNGVPSTSGFSWNGPVGSSTALWWLAIGV